MLANVGFKHQEKLQEKRLGLNVPLVFQGF